MASLFFSYSHKDESLRNELEVHLAMLKREGAIDAWHDRKILAGDELDGAINEKLEVADVILLLVSPDFLASAYCYDVEVKRAMERHETGSARVIAAILRPCDWHGTPFAKLLVTPTDGKPVTKWPDRDDAFLDVVNQIRKALPKNSASSTPSFQPICSATGLPVQPVGQPALALPRSSNLRVKKNFTDVERDRFMDESFEFMALFFEGSLLEFQKRYPGVETKFKRVDAQSYTAVIYRNGDAVARCTIRHGGATPFGNGITYTYGDKESRNSVNEILNLEVGEQSLSLKPMGMSSISRGSNHDSHLTSEGAAELYWAMLIEPLQR